MKKNIFLKKGLAIALSSTCGIVAATSIITTTNSINNNIVNVNKQSYFASSEDINNNPNFKVETKVMQTNNDFFVIKQSFKNNFPLDIAPNGYWTLDYWQKTYDNGEVQNIYPTSEKVEETVKFYREDRTYKVKKIVEWNTTNGLAFTTNSEETIISKKMSTSITKIKDESEKSQFRIYLKSINSGNELIQMTLEKVSSNKNEIIDSKIDNWNKVSDAQSWLHKDNNGVYYYDTSELYKDVDNTEYKFTYSLTTEDKTVRTDTISFNVSGLNKVIKLQEPTIKSTDNDSVNILVSFDKYQKINDYKVLFVEVDKDGKEIQNGYVPTITKVSDNEFKLLKDSTDRKYKVKVSSDKLGISTTSNNIISVDKKESIDNNNGNNGNENNGNNGNENNGNGGNNTKPENPDVPEINDSNISNQTKNSFSKSTITIMTLLVIISLISVACSIIFFINMRKKDKK